MHIASLKVILHLSLRMAFGYFRFSGNPTLAEHELFQAWTIRLR